jgi:hypothetical protein
MSVEEIAHARRDAGPRGKGIDPNSPSRILERRILLARLRWNLMSASRSLIRDLRRDGIEVHARNVESALILHVASTRPRSAIVPWHMPDEIVLKVIRIVAEGLA